MGKLVPKGMYGVVLTPFNSKGEVDESVLEAEIGYCIATKVKGLLACGSTGEFVYMSPEQNRQVLKICAQKAVGKKILIGGASATTEERVLSNLSSFMEMGYDFSIICPPYYYPQNPEDILSFYLTVSHKAPKGVKIILYNIPFCAPGIPLSILPKLMECENIVGLKDSSGDLLYLSRALYYASCHRPEFSIFSGQDSAILSGLTLGAQGCMSSLSWILHDSVCSILECYDNGEQKRAELIQSHIVGLVDYLSAIPFPENYRALAEVKGIPCGIPQRAFASLAQPAITQWKEGAEKIISSLAGL